MGFYLSANAGKIDNINHKERHMRGWNMETTHEGSSCVFKALSDENRLNIIELLRSGDKCACALIKQMDISQSGLSYHMKVLCDSGIVYSRQEGKWTYYGLCEAGRDSAVDLLLTLTTPNTENNNCCNR